MKLYRILEQRGPQLFRWLVLLLLVLGVALRIIIWWQGRNLVIDEANVARNLYESGFAQLAQPLKYEQYAPPIFLWLEKTVAILFGFSERALWIYPLLCGIGAVFVLYKVAKKIMPETGTWLTTGLFALGSFYVEYSATLKQYMPDAFIGLLLVLIALNTDYSRERKRRFTLIWILAGSIAIWSSMPSVFVLAGIGIYYSLQVLKERKWPSLGLLCVIFVVWGLQFLFYYKTILEAQADSQYLQNYHRDFFLYALPSAAAEWEHNLDRLYEIIGYMGGWTAVAMGANLLFLFTGIIILARKHVTQFTLIFVPVIGVLMAAAFNKFSLIERVIMFLYPLLLLLVGYGFSQIWRIRFVPVKVVLLVAGLIIVFGYAKFPLYFNHKRQTFEITEGLSYLAAKKVQGKQLYVPGPCVATYIYYTTVHPRQKEYQILKGAHLLTWSDNFSDVTRTLTDTTWFIFSEDFKETERNKRIGEIEQHMKQFDYFEKYNSFVLGYLPKPHL